LKREINQIQKELMAKETKMIQVERDS
jgi:hypothetical protein